MADNQKFSWLRGKLWIIPLGLFLATCWSVYRGIRSTHSGSTTPGPNGGIVDSVTNVHYWQTGGGVFSFILFGVLIIVLLLMRSDR